MDRRALPLLFFLVLGGCAAQTLQAASREVFAYDTSCPPDRVSVTPRPDIAKPASPEPPYAVAKDPGRLAYWRKQHAVELDKADSTEIFQLEGCGEKRVASCTWNTTWVGENPVNYASCTPIE
jgi:hypothetical protein